MFNRRALLLVLVLTAATWSLGEFDSQSIARAQFPQHVTTFHAPPAPVVVGQPVVTYMPRRAGLLGLRTVYRPEVGILLPPMAAPAPVATTTFFAPAVPVMSAPTVGVPTTTFMAPAVPVTTFSVPVTPGTVHPQFSAPVMVSPAPVTTFFAPAAPSIPTQGFSNFVPGY